MSSVRRSLALALGLGLTVALGSGRASAGEPDVARARDAYDRGVNAEQRGDHASAARAFAEADTLAPSVASLEAALESSMRADDPALGAELLERAEARVTDAGLAKTLDAAKKRFAGRSGKIRVDCGFAQTCLVAVDGTARDATRAVHVSVGAHTVVVERDGERLDKLVDVHAGEVVVLAPEEPGVTVTDRKTSPKPIVEAKGLSPAFFWVGVGLTAALGGLTIASRLDASAKHDRFERDGCGLGGTGPVPDGCSALAKSGESADTRTVLALGATGVLAIGTALTGLFFVRWDEPKKRGFHATPWVAQYGAGAAVTLPWP